MTDWEGSLRMADWEGSLRMAGLCGVPAAHLSSRPHTFVIPTAVEGSHPVGREILRFAALSQDDRLGGSLRMTDWRGYLRVKDWRGYLRMTVWGAISE